MLAQYTAMYAQANGVQGKDIYDFAPSFDRPKMDITDALKASGMLGN